MGPVPAAAADLPITIGQAQWNDPSLLIGGDGWSFSTTCSWRLVGPKGLRLSWSDRDAADSVWDLIGHEVTSVAADPAVGDITLGLSDGLRLEVFGDTLVEPWVLKLPHAILVGPLTAEDIGPQA